MYGMTTSLMIKSGVNTFSRSSASTGWLLARTS